MSYNGNFPTAGTSHPGFNIWYDTAGPVSEERRAAVWSGEASGEHGAARPSQLQPWLSGEETKQQLVIFSFTTINRGSKEGDVPLTTASR